MNVGSVGDINSDAATDIQITSINSADNQVLVETIFGSQHAC